MSDVCHGMSYTDCKQDTGAGGSGITAVDSLQILHKQCFAVQGSLSGFLN